jgi:replicative DNA helicase
MTPNTKSQKDDPNVMKYPPAFQRGVLKLMLSDHRFCHRCCEILQPGHFAGNLSWFFTQIKEFFEENGVLPPDSALSSDISKHNDVKKEIEYEQTLKDIWAEVVSPRDIKNKMTEFIRANLFVSITKKGVSLYNRPETRLEAYQFFKEEADRILNTTFEDDRFSRFGDAESVLDRLMFERQLAIPTGIHLIDQSMGGGLMPGTLTTFLGASNVGKSMLMPNLAYFAVKAGHKVFVTIHEDEENPTKARYLSRFSGVPFHRLAYGYGSLTAQEMVKVNEADAILKENVVMRFMYTAEATVEYVMDTCRALQREFPFSLYLCDYGQCLSTKEAKGLREVRHINAHVYFMLKQLALEMNIAVVSGAQVNRNGMQMNKAGTDFLRMTDVSEAIGIALKSSNLITMNRSDDNKKANRITYLLDKVRNGKCPVAVSCDTKFECATTHHDAPGAQGEVNINDGPDQSMLLEQEAEKQAKEDAGLPRSASN